MLKVQDYLRVNGLEKLKEEFAIHTLPLFILNYNQIDSPKTIEVVRECRGLTLELNTWNLVARSFSRFFNWGEVQDEMKLFDFSNCSIQSKEDGSLCVFYYYDGKWRVNTRGSFAEDKMQFQDFTWTEAIVKALGLQGLNDLNDVLNPKLTYVCEFCSVYNKIVRKYDAPTVFLLTIFNGEKELPADEVNAVGNFVRPEMFEFHNIEEIQKHIEKRAETDATYEGVVIRDCNNLRFKVKSAKYLGLHRLRGEQENGFNPKHLLPFILTGDSDELLNYFPEVKEKYLECETKVNDAFGQLTDIWQKCHQIESQKDFALAIVNETPFSGILFWLRKTKKDGQTIDDLKEIWRNSGDMIIKYLF